jgi:L-lactate dehydrogenase complex protein LldG
MTKRAEILTRIRQSLKTGLLPEADRQYLDRDSGPAAHFQRTALIESFVAELQAVGGEAFQPASHSEAIEIVVKLIQAVDQRVLAWPDEELPLAGIGEALQNVGIQRIAATISNDPAKRHMQWAALDPIRVGLTGALGGLANTGSLAVLSGEHRSRAASLLPEVHIALLPIDRLVPTMGAFIAAHSALELTARSSNLVFITGPSRTADIEMVTTRGVHGPKRLCVVLLQ